MNGENFLTVKQAALRLRMNPKTVRVELASGKIRGVKKGTVWQIPQSAIAEQKTRAQIEAEIEADFEPEPKAEPEPEQSAPASARRCLPKWIRPALDAN